MPRCTTLVLEPHVRPFTHSNTYISQTSWPNAITFYMNHLWDENVVNTTDPSFCFILAGNEDHRRLIYLSFSVKILKLNIGETRWPKLVKFDVKHHLGGENVV